MQDSVALEGKTIAELREIGKVLGITDTSLKKKALVAKIMEVAAAGDSGASDTADTAAKPAEQPAKRGRRPRMSGVKVGGAPKTQEQSRDVKEQGQDTAVDTSAPSEEKKTAEAKTPEVPQKRRGRKPKAAAVVEDTVAENLFDRDEEAEKETSDNIAAAQEPQVAQHIDEMPKSEVVTKDDFTGEIAGKTGTTNDQADGWFIGYTPVLTAGVWVGAEDRQVHFESLTFGQGSNMALPIWAIFMNKVLEDGTLGITGEEKFIAPAGMHLNLDCDGSDADVVSDSGGDDFFD